MSMTRLSIENQPGRSRLESHSDGGRSPGIKRRIARLTRPVLVLVFGFTAASSGIASDARLSIDSTCAVTEWAVNFDGKRILAYSFHPETAKPYVRELHALNGLNVLRDAPADHLHHHGLMYAIRINGVNFWEETSGHGVQRVAKSSPPEPGL